jgi:ribosomal protein L34E
MQVQKTNWKKLVNPEYLGAYSLDDGNGTYADIVVTIQRVKVETVIGPDGKKEDCPVAYFEERGTKPMILNVTNMKTLERLTKSKYIEDWAGRKIQIGVEKVKAFGDIVDALRIRNFPPRTKETPKCADTGAEITATEKMTVQQIVAWTQRKFGRPLCAERATELVEQAKQAEADKSEQDEADKAEQEETVQDE